MSTYDRFKASSSDAKGQHTPASLADVLERDYFPMPEGAKLYLAEHEWRMVVNALRSASAPQSEKPAIPEGWKLVPMLGTRVSANHPVTCLNPEPTFEVVAIKADSFSIFAKGANTMWFGVGMLAAAPKQEEK